MTILTARPVNQFLTEPKSRLGNLVKKAKQLSQLDCLFHAIVDTEIGSHCQVANLINNTLVLLVDNATWATRLRYAIPNLLKTLKVQPEFRDVRKISYRVRGAS